MEKYKTYKLSEIATVQTGPFGSQLHQEDYVQNGTPIITVEHLGENRIIHENVPRVSDEDKERLSKYSLQTNDIVFSRVGSVDRRALVREKENGWLFSGRCLRVRANSKNVDSRFLSFYFGQESFKEYIRGIAVGATMPSINTKILSDIKIILPPIVEQKAIAKILSSLDNKIELNRQMNATLEAMARALFKAWFVDFEPVRANMENRVSESASPEIAKLFPLEFENGIPKGWKQKTLTEFFRLIGGGTPKTTNPEFWNGKILWYSVVDAPNESDVFVIDTEKKITQLGLEKSSTKLLREGLTIISARGTVGRLAITGSEMAMNQSCYAIEGKFGDYFNFYVVREAITELKQNTHGAVFDTITQNTFKTVLSVLPAQGIIDEFEKKVQVLMAKIKNNLKETRNLEQIRDRLLPRLISGKLSAHS